MARHGKLVGLCDICPYIVVEIISFAGQLTDGYDLRWCNSASQYPLLTYVYTCHPSTKGGHTEEAEIAVTIQLITGVSGDWCVERGHSPFRLGWEWMFILSLTRFHLTIDCWGNNLKTCKVVEWWEVNLRGIKGNGKSREEVGEKIYILLFTCLNIQYSLERLDNWSERKEESRKMDRGTGILTKLKVKFRKAAEWLALYDVGYKGIEKRENLIDFFQIIILFLLHVNFWHFD